MYRVILLVVVAAVFPAVTLGASNGTKCDVYTAKLNASRLELDQCWDNVFNILVDRNQTKEIICKNVTDLENKIKLHFNNANETCPGNDWNMRSQTLMDMLKATADHVPELRKFADASCDNMTTSLSTCYTKSQRKLKISALPWWNRFNLFFQEITCAKANVIKNCTITELKQNCPDTVDYVELMYNVSLTECPEEPQPKSAASATYLSATIPLILVQYLLANVN